MNEWITCAVWACACDKQIETYMQAHMHTHLHSHIHVHRHAQTARQKRKSEKESDAKKRLRRGLCFEKRSFGIAKGSKCWTYRAVAKLGLTVCCYHTADHFSLAWHRAVRINRQFSWYITWRPDTRMLKPGRFHDEKRLLQEDRALLTPPPPHVRCV